MGIEREDFSQDAPDEVEDNAAKLLKEKEESDAKLAALEKRAQDAELARARAEGEAEGLKRVPQSNNNQQTPQWTDEQWESEGAKNGMTGLQLKATVSIAETLAANKVKQFEERTSAAEREAKEAKEEAKRAKSGNSLYAVEQKFYADNIGLTGHRGEVDAFLSKLPASVKEDPKAYAEALDMAKTFVRGKVREGLQTRRSTQENNTRQNTNERQEFAEEREENNNDQPEVDVSDLDNEGARNLVERLARNPGPDGYASRGEVPLSEMKLEDAFKKTSMKDGRGVAIDERADWERGNRRSEKSLNDGQGLGGRKGK